VLFGRQIGAVAPRLGHVQGVKLLIPPLPAGIPAISEYEGLLRSSGFAAVERSSERFLATHRSVVRPYGRKWVSDPLHQWSRQWEYPFTLSRIAAELDHRRGSEPVRILDAGSGVTFLPFLVAETFPHASVCCCDWDSSLASIFAAINNRQGARAEFVEADLHELPFEPAEFDVVYSISVLEHTDRRPAIVDEFHRVLKPGGKLIVTFDLPVRPEEDDEGVRDMLSALAEKFDADQGDGEFDLLTDRSPEDGLTTSYAATLDRRLLPWRHPLLYRLSCLLSGHGWVPWPPAMTVACLSMTKTT
jgi:SAM-dependent methyltransferase